MKKQENILENKVFNYGGELVSLEFFWSFKDVDAAELNSIDMLEVGECGYFGKRENGFFKHTTRVK